MRCIENIIDMSKSSRNTTERRVMISGSKITKACSSGMSGWMEKTCSHWNDMKQ